VTTEPTRLGIREARAILPELIQRAAAGERFILTVRGVDRCALVPLAEPPKQPAKRRPAK
jgi:antitoxin (DNA-binding transcriptional repressor) of toxin-antitoxin stability system